MFTAIPPTFVVDAFALAGVKACANLDPELAHTLADGAGATDRTRRPVERRKHAVARDVDDLTAMDDQELTYHVLEPIAHVTPTAVSSSLACSVEPTTSTTSTVARNRSASSISVREPVYELLDRAEQLRFRERPVICARELDEPCAFNVLGEVLRVTKADIRVVAAVVARGSAL